VLSTVDMVVQRRDSPHRLRNHDDDHSTDLLTARGVAHLVVHGTTGSTSYETIPPVPLESSGGVLWIWWCNDATALAGYAT